MSPMPSKTPNFVPKAFWAITLRSCTCVVKLKFFSKDISLTDETILQVFEYRTVALVVIIIWNIGIQTF